MRTRLPPCRLRLGCRGRRAGAPAPGWREEEPNLDSVAMSRTIGHGGAHEHQHSCTLVAPGRASGLYRGRVMHAVSSQQDTPPYGVWYLWPDSMSSARSMLGLCFTYNRRTGEPSGTANGARDGSPLSPWIERHLERPASTWRRADPDLCFPRVFGTGSIRSRVGSATVRRRPEGDPVMCQNLRRMDTTWCPLLPVPWWPRSRPRCGPASQRTVRITVHRHGCHVRLHDAGS